MRQRVAALDEQRIFNAKLGASEEAHDRMRSSIRSTVVIDRLNQSRAEAAPSASSQPYQQSGDQVHESQQYQSRHLPPSQQQHQQQQGGSHVKDFGSSSEGQGGGNDVFRLSDMHTSRLDPEVRSMISALGIPATPPQQPHFTSSQQLQQQPPLQRSNTQNQSQSSRGLSETTRLNTAANAGVSIGAGGAQSRLYQSTIAQEQLDVSTSTSSVETASTGAAAAGRGVSSAEKRIQAMVAAALASPTRQKRL